MSKITNRMGIAEKLQIRRILLPLGRTRIFPPAPPALPTDPGVIPEMINRYIVSITLAGNGVVGGEVAHIERLEEDLITHTSLFTDIVVPATGRVPLVPDWNGEIDNPFMICEGGTNLVANAVTGGRATLTVIFWDDIL